MVASDALLYRYTQRSCENIAAAVLSWVVDGFALADVRQVSRHHVMSVVARSVILVVLVVMVMGCTPPVRRSNWHCLCLPAGLTWQGWGITWAHLSRRTTHLCYPNIVHHGESEVLKTSCEPGRETIDDFLQIASTHVDKLTTRITPCRIGIRFARVLPLI